MRNNACTISIPAEVEVVYKNADVECGEYGSSFEPLVYSATREF